MLTNNYTVIRQTQTRMGGGQGLASVATPHVTKANPKGRPNGVKALARGTKCPHRPPPKRKGMPEAPKGSSQNNAACKPAGQRGVPQLTPSDARCRLWPLLAPVEVKHHSTSRIPSRAVRNGKEKVLRNEHSQKSLRQSMCSTMVGGGWRLAVGGWRLATGGRWRLVVVGGGWPWLAVGGWRRLVVGGRWRLAVGGGWRLVAVGG